MPECPILLRSISSVLSSDFVSGLKNLVMIISSCTLLWIRCPLKNQSTSSGGYGSLVALHKSRMAPPSPTNSVPDKSMAETRTRTHVHGRPLYRIKLMVFLITYNTWSMYFHHVTNKIHLFYLQRATKHISHLITLLTSQIWIIKKKLQYLRTKWIRP